MYRVDLHTHSIISYDGGIRWPQYRRFLADLNSIIAVTDHNEISFALDLQKEFPNQAIVGEEILTEEGEVIGLYLNKLISPHQSLTDTIQQIKQQGGLVYVPHPLEHTRKGLSLEALEKIVGQIDIIEVFNARAKEPWLNKKVEEFAHKNNLVATASSDAHSLSGLGTTFTNVDTLPTKETLVDLLRKGQLEKQRASLGSMFAPLYYKIKKKLGL